MVAFDEEDLNEAQHVDSIEGDFYIDNQVILSKLAQDLDRQQHPKLAQTIRAVGRVWSIRTTDIVDGSNMVGAKVTYVDGDGELHRGVVIEPEVAGMSANEAYDPNRDEMVDPSEYPMGTVNLVYGKEDEIGEDEFYFSRFDDLEVATSITPARKPDTTYCYYAGWDYYNDQAE